MQYPNNMCLTRGSKADLKKSIIQFQFPELRRGNILLPRYFDCQGEGVVVRNLSGQL